MPSRADALIVMTKAPEAGRSKTRLVPPLSFEEAADLAHALLVDQLENLSGFAGASRFIAYAPDGAAGFFEPFAGLGFDRFPQRGASLGARMAHAFAHLFASGFGRVVLIGGDLPLIPLSVMERAYSVLAGTDKDVVLGPAADGGYYLVGMKRPIAGVFTGIRWSRPDVLARTVEKLAGLGLRHELLLSLYDIDTVADLVRLSSHPAVRDGSMKNTLRLLNELRRRGRVWI